MIDMNYILGNGKSKKQTKDPLRDLFGIKPSHRAKPKSDIINQDFLSGFIGQGHPRPDIKTKQQKAFLKRTAIGTGKSHLRFMDLDGDGVISGLDCAPKNPKKHMAWKRPEDYDYIEEMSPREYLRKTKSDNFGRSGDYIEEEYYDNETEKMENVSKLGERIKDQTSKVPIPFVEPSGDHEGRHRALGAERQGIKKIPVKMPPPSSWRSKEVTNSFMEKRFKNAGDDYKEGWRKRIQRDNFPEERMDGDSRKAYVEALREKGLLKEGDEDEA